MTGLLVGTAQERLPDLTDASVDLILADLPYGKTRNAWDRPFDLEWMWAEFYRVAKPTAAIVLFAQGTFAVDLIVSNRADYRYDLIWEKDRPSGHLNSGRMPMRSHEQILLFYRRLPTYNPQKLRGAASHSRGRFAGARHDKNNYGAYQGRAVADDGEVMKQPRSVLHFARPHPMVHPTQKPVELCAWLIRTFSNQGDVVLDPACGSGTTLVAAEETGRRWIGIEPHSDYVEVARSRIGSFGSRLF